MTVRVDKAIVSALVFAILGFGCTGVVKSQYVIANTSLDIERLSDAQMRAIFTGRLKTIKGKRLNVYILSEDHNTHNDFAENLLDMYTHQIDSFWSRAVYSGRSQAPRIVEDTDKMIEHVAEDDNAIGYISEKPIDNPNVVIVAARAHD